MSLLERAEERMVMGGGENRGGEGRKKRK